MGLTQTERDDATISQT
ncbi:hypothetical protein HF086_012214, partial [Spodoptera exigua]